MSLLSEVSKTVINAQLAFTSSLVEEANSAVSTSSGLSVQPYVSVDGPIVIPGLSATNFNTGAFDQNVTTFVYPVVPGPVPGQMVLRVFANNAAAGAPPQFTLAATVPVVGSSTDTFNLYATLSANGLTCAVVSGNDNVGAGLLAVFTRPTVLSQAWTQVATIHGAATTTFGDSVSMSADASVIAVGATLDGLAGTTSVYNFDYNTGNITLAAKLVGTGAVTATQQGYSVAVSGDGLTLAVGGPLDNTLYGAVWMFKNVSGTWTQTGAKLTPYNASKQAAFIGSAVGLSYDGTRLAVGAEQCSLVENSGCVFMYDLVDGTWIQGQTIYPLGVRNTLPSVFSVSLSYDGNVLFFDQFNNNTTYGGVFVYNLLPNGLWVQNGAIRAPVGTGNPGFTLVGASRSGSVFATVDQQTTNMLTIFQ